MNKRRQRKPKKPKGPAKAETEWLYGTPVKPILEPEIPPLEPIWTENKAKLIERYLYYFVLITKHGTYIDAFAAPQEPDLPHTWAAKLVMESDPRWLRNLFLFDNNKIGIAALKQLRDDERKKDPTRRIEVFPGDCNLEIIRLLRSETIKPTEACFCLLDQRTFECKWNTLVALARYKPTGHKIELFYFLPHHWLRRALSGLRNETILQDWWGRDDWESLHGMTVEQIRAAFIKRFKTELGYASVKAWPIYERRDRGNTMYYMIHATDHLAAPKLMARAYKRAVFPREPMDQLPMDWDRI